MQVLQNACTHYHVLSFIRVAFARAKRVFVFPKIVELVIGIQYYLLLC